VLLSYLLVDFVHVSVFSNCNALCVTFIQVALLESTVARLLDISSTPLSLTDPSSQCQDIAQVHAINILRILVQDSSLVTAVSRFYATLTMQALNGFMSPVWAMRNASLQLLGNTFV